MPTGTLPGAHSPALPAPGATVPGYGGGPWTPDGDQAPGVAPPCGRRRYCAPGPQYRPVQPCRSAVFPKAGRTLPFLSTPATGDPQGPPAKPLPRPGSPEAGYSLRSGDPGAPWLQRLQPGQARPGSRPGTPRDPRRGLDPAQGAPRPGTGSGPGDPHLRGTPGPPGGPVDPLLSTPRRALSGLTGRGQRTAWTWWYKSRRAPMGLLWT